MSLLHDYAKLCAVLVRDKGPDGAGGFTVGGWEEGKPFTAFFALDSSNETRHAERQGVESTFSVLTARDVSIREGDYFKDLGSGETYFVTSRPEENCAPRSASFDLKRFTAERRKPPDDER